MLWLRRLLLQDQIRSPNFPHASCAGVFCAAARAVISAKLDCAVSTFVNWQAKGSFPAFANHHGKFRH